MLNIIIYLLLFFVPGFISVPVFELFSGRRLTCCKSVWAGMIFNLLILIFNFFALSLFRHICTLKELICSFNSLSFIAKYGLLSIIAGIIAAIIGGITFHWWHHKKHCRNR